MDFVWSDYVGLVAQGAIGSVNAALIGSLIAIPVANTAKNFYQQQDCW